MILEAGDFAAAPDPGNEIFTRGLLEGMHRLDYAATALGERELAGGERVRETLRRSKLRVLSANLPRKARRQWGAEPFTIVQFPRFSVGILGMTGRLDTDFRPGLTPKVPPGSPALEDYRRTLERYLGKLAKRCTVLVVLTQADLGKAMEILREFPQIDVLVSSREAVMARTPLQVGRSIALFAGTEGQRVGHLHLRIYPDRTVGMVWGQSALLREQIGEDPGLRDLTRRITAEANDWHRVRAEAALAASREPSPPDEGAFRTAAACRECHAGAYDVWQGSAHARAMRSLEGGSQDFLPECVSCHVTGMGAPGGFRDRLSTPRLAEVQCEACHGPGAAHLLDPAADYGSSGLRMCAETCHTSGQTGGDFDAERAWEAIRH